MPKYQGYKHYGEPPLKIIRLTVAMVGPIPGTEGEENETAHDS